MKLKIKLLKGEQKTGSFLRHSLKLKFYQMKVNQRFSFKHQRYLKLESEIPSTTILKLLKGGLK